MTSTHKTSRSEPWVWTIWACPDCGRDRGPIATYVYRSCECGSHKPQREVEVLSRQQSEQTTRSQRGMLKQQGEEITRLRRQVRGAQAQNQSCERTNGRIAKDLGDAWELIWRVAGGAITGGSARQAARNHLLNRKSTEQDRG